MARTDEADEVARLAIMPLDANIAKDLYYVIAEAEEALGLPERSAVLGGDPPAWWELTAEPHTMRIRATNRGFLIELLSSDTRQSVTERGKKVSDNLRTRRNWEGAKAVIWDAIHVLRLLQQDARPKEV